MGLIYLCLAQVVSFCNEMVGFVAMVMSLAALVTIPDLGSGYAGVGWYGGIFTFVVACACLWSGFLLMDDFIKASTYFSPLRFRTNSTSSYVRTFWFYTGVEVVGFLAPYFFVKDYQAKIEIFIAVSWKFCSFHLLLVNPLSIGLFVYQFVSFWIVHLCIQSRRSRAANLAAANAGRRNLASTATATTTTTAPTQPQPQVAISRASPGISTSTVRIEDENRPSAPPPPAQQLYSHRQTKNKNRKIGGHHSAKIATAATATNPRSGLYPNLEQFGSEDSASSSTSATYSKSSENAVKFSFAKAKSEPNRKFESLKSKSLHDQRQFEDPDFPANDGSLKIRNERFEWLRPREISANPQFFCDGANRFDVKQGKLGNCWFLAAVDNLTLNEELFEQVVPSDNSWDDDDYAGICHFRFWSSGAWKEVVIDDRLPTQGGKLVFMQSSEKNEFWSSLLEKAFAKLTGSYGDLNGGFISKAMKHLTGGSTEEIRLRGRNPNGLFVQMENALEEGCLLGCAIFARCGQNDSNSNGLVGGHAYSISKVQRVTRQGTFKNLASEDVGLIRIRNPWGNEVERSGEWSDGHHLWNQVDKKTRQQLQEVMKDDGEFWFPITKFGEYFDVLTICYLPTTAACY